MSIRYIVGNPGSGKSYLGAKVLYDAFIRPRRVSIFEFFKAYKKGDYKGLEKTKNESSFNVAYTNINEFKFDINPKIKKFDFNEFFRDLSILYLEYKKPDVDDSKLNKKAQELGLYKALFVLDEVHNFFEKDNEVLKWWLTYHRHLYQELYFITQDLNLVSNEYKSIAEYFYKAVDSAKRFFSKKFRYIQYSGYKLYQKDIIKKFHIDFEQEVFNLYHSGNNGLGKSAVKKFMWIALFFALIVFILFKILISVFFTTDADETPVKNDVNVTKIRSENSKNLNKNIDIKENNNLDYYYYTFSCIDNFCSFQNSTDLFRYEILTFLISKTKVLFEIKRSHLKGLISYDFILKDDVFKPLNIRFKQKGKTDETLNSNFGDFGFNPTSSSSKK